MSESFTLPDGMLLGCLPRENNIGDLVPCASREDIPRLNRNEWVDQSKIRYLETWKRNIYQERTNACCIASLGHAIMFTIAKMGDPVPDPDWKKFFNRLSPRGGGVYLDTAIRAAMDDGYPMLDGSLVKVTEAYDAEDIEQVGSALQRGYVITFGHDRHAECGLTLSGGLIDTINSWDRTWGDKGYHEFPLDDVEIKTYGCIILCALEVIRA